MEFRASLALLPEDSAPSPEIARTAADALTASSYFLLDLPEEMLSLIFAAAGGVGMAVAAACNKKLLQRSRSEAQWRSICDAAGLGGELLKTMCDNGDINWKQLFKLAQRCNHTRQVTTCNHR